MLFSREFENVVNRAFLVLNFLGEKLVGANFYAFCNYGVSIGLICLYILEKVDIWTVETHSLTHR